MDRSILKTFPDLAKEWSDKNLPLTPAVITYASHKKVIWKGKCGHEWAAVVKSRTMNHTGCPYCTHNKVLPGFNDLATRYPELAQEWSNKNLPLSPAQVTPFSNRKVWWKGTCGHEWFALISSRAAGHGCPYCRDHKLLRGFNDFATLHPELAMEWSDRNLPQKPGDIPEKATGSYWWKCKICGGEYQAWLTSRLSGSKCPYCSGRVIKKGLNDLATTDPEIASEWNPYRNGKQTPFQITRTSCVIRWWKCKYGHEWKAKVSDRTLRHSTCPACERILLSLLPKLLFFYYAKVNGLDVYFNSDREIGLPLEIFMPDLKTAFETEEISKQGIEVQRVKQFICVSHGICYMIIKRCNTAEATVAIVRKALQKANLYIGGDPMKEIHWAREHIKRTILENAQVSPKM